MYYYLKWRVNIGPMGEALKKCFPNCGPLGNYIQFGIKVENTFFESLKENS